MRRTKHHIITYIPAPVLTDYLYGICEMAEHWSNEIIVVYSVDHWSVRGGSAVPEGVATYGLPSASWSRVEAYSIVASKGGVRSTRPCAIVSLEPHWFISDPHIVREAIELNPGKVLYANRYFMIQDDQYRADGVFAPIRVAPIFPYRSGAHFNDENDTAPAHVWTSSNWGEAPFSILDYQMYGQQDGTLRTFEGMIPI